MLLFAAVGLAQPLPRTPDGKPDLQGIWTNATITPLERVPALANKLTVTEAEAKAYETKANAATYGDTRSKNAEQDRDHAYNSLFFDKGTELARVDGQKRTSLIVDPPDGKVPPLTPEGRQRLAARLKANQVKFDRVQDRPLAERCLLAFGSSSGPPMLPVLYNNNYQIVQTPTHILILVEMVHDARIIRLNGTHPGPEVKQWLGDSIGRWEGDTLVVDTANFSDKINFRGANTSLHLVERFRRVDANTILYRATIEDPTTFTKPWTVEYPFRAAQGPIYEYACHEGNYSMFDILGGARRQEQEKQ